MRSTRSPAERRDQRGAAVVDFVLVAIVLVPLFLGIVQVALVMHVRSTLAAAATEGARYAATIDRGPAAGAAHTRRRINDALAARYASRVSADEEVVDGLRAVVVHVHAEVPPLGLWGPSVSFDVVGHGVEEAQ
ncbi:TadE family protein [Nocardioides terrisoli]|uniref:TadE family protein n=1 Tax=Nocardioides terrisoli TaxID=3388267 RepID=UPI00287BC420|nr:pilus assembly protein [Nocardioides marmorisolisilvae]